jgi:hypothetical protein
MGWTFVLCFGVIAFFYGKKNAPSCAQRQRFGGLWYWGVCLNQDL